MGPSTGQLFVLYYQVVLFPYYAPWYAAAKVWGLM